MKPLILAFALALAIVPIAGAQSLDERIDPLFEALSQPGSPGAAVAVLKDGEVVFRKGYGLAQLEYDVPITPETIFHVASVSKQFTAFMAVLLSLDGRLSLDDDIRMYLPEVHDFGTAITLRHLIHHTSGLRDQWDLLVLSGAWRMDDVITKDDILYLVGRQRELNFEPGEKHLYCNTGYTLLGEICARVGGKPFPELCKERIFEPLGMSNTHFHDDHQHAVKNRAYSYAKSDNGFRNSVLSYANAGATSLFTTVDDLLKWQSNFETKELGGEKAMELMLSTEPLNSGRRNSYGYALSHGAYKGVPMISHGGADAGFRSFLGRFPEQHLSVALASNLANADAGGLALKVAEVFLGDALVESPGERASPEVDDVEFMTRDEDALEGFEGFYVNRRTGEFVRFVAAKDELKFVRTGQPAVSLGPIDATTFRPKTGPGGLRVRFEGAGSDLQAVFTQEGEEIDRLDLAGERSTDADYLAQFVGTYYSDELDATYRFTLDDRDLAMHRVKMAPLKLGTRFRDGFSGERYSLFFTRNPIGAVDGFRISTGRVLGLRFERVAEPMSSN